MKINIRPVYFSLFITLLMSDTFVESASTPKTIKPESTIDQIKHTMYSLAASLQSFYRKDIFHKDEYEQYMKLIQELDASVYEKLRNYEQEFDQPAFLKAVDREPTALLPRKETHGQPMMVLPSPVGLSKKQQRRLLSRFLQSYRALEQSQFYQRQLDLEAKITKDWGYYIFYDKCSHYVAILKEKMGVKSNLTKFHSDSFETDPHYKPPTPFPADEYEQYMQLIKAIDPVVYEQLNEYEAYFSEPGLLKSQYVFNEDVQEKNGYPIIILNLQKGESEESQKLELEIAISLYKACIPLKERTAVLALIKSLAPELYQEIVAVDPTGKDHLKFDKYPTNASVSRSPKDDLPVITLGKNILQDPQEEQRFIIGHELGHYALGHRDLSHHKPIHTTLKTVPDLPQDSATERKNSRFKFEEAFCRAYSRENEYEADRFSILTMKTNSDAASSWFQKSTLQAQSQNKSARHTFLNTHPQNHARIEHFESLSREVELQKARGEKGAPINWKALIEKYKNSSWEKMREAL